MGILIVAEQIFYKPLRDVQRLTSGFNALRDGKPHGGIDLVSSSGFLVRAITDGIVVRDFDGYNPKYRWDCNLPHSCGNAVTIAHKINGVWYLIRYIHLMANTVTAGNYITAGEGVGTYSDAGYSLGAHIHMDARLASNGSVVNIETLFSTLGIL